MTYVEYSFQSETHNSHVSNLDFTRSTWARVISNSCHCTMISSEQKCSVRESDPFVFLFFVDLYKQSVRVFFLLDIFLLVAPFTVIEVRRVEKRSNSDSICIQVTRRSLIDETPTVEKKDSQLTRSRCPPPRRTHRTRKSTRTDDVNGHGFFFFLLLQP